MSSVLNSFGRRRLALIIITLHFWAFPSLVSIVSHILYLISFACFLVLLGGGIFLAGVSLSSFLRLYVDMVSLYIFIGSVFFVSGGGICACTG